MSIFILGISFLTLMSSCLEQVRGYRLCHWVRLWLAPVGVFGLAPVGVFGLASVWVFWLASVWVVGLAPVRAEIFPYWRATHHLVVLLLVV
jgi:hypothetical protein